MKYFGILLVFRGGKNEEGALYTAGKQCSEAWEIRQLSN